MDSDTEKEMLGNGWKPDYLKDMHTGEVRVMGMTATDDVVNHPLHYNQSGIVECIDAIEAVTGEGFEHYLQGNIMKYLWRYRYKNGVEDLKKAQWYLNKMIEVVENAGKNS